DPKPLWLHSLVVATAARELATTIRFADAGSCFTAGLLHDMGKIALAKLDADRLAAACAMMRGEGVSQDVAEKKHGLMPHDQVGARLAKQWKFPAGLAAPIEHHHAIYRLEIRERLAPTLRTITEIVAVADHLALLCQPTFTNRTFEEDGEIDAGELFARNGLALSQRDALCDRTKSQLERSKIFLSLVA
ncbi:MAG TPA: HDOD domain-containing protein, partial [Kofleriaceae bacterium]|nr:HDOD domain-containing protein [Kofleriaceae bacterium]